MAHERFQTVEGQINWNAPMYKLYEKAKRNGGWNPADIDFSRDREDFLQLREERKDCIIAAYFLFFRRGRSGYA